MQKAGDVRSPGGVDGPRIRERRLALGLTQSDLATRSGLSQEAISRLENGRIRGLMQPTQDALALALDVSVSWLRGGADHAPPPPATRLAPAAPASSITPPDAPASEPVAEPDGEPDDDAGDPLMHAVSRSFDARRHHLLVDANRVLDTLRAADRRLVADAELPDTTRAWLDAASGLRREGVAVTTENLLLRVTVHRAATRAR